MIISAFKSGFHQPWLFDVPLGNHGHARTVIGDLAERLTARLTGGRRHRTQGTADYCPDVSFRGTFFESKAAGLSKQTFVYAGRLEKDRRFVRKGNPLSYVIWHHGADTKLARTVRELEELVLANLRCVHVVPFPCFDAVCRTLPEEKLNSGYGGHVNRSKVYGSGFRVFLRLLDPWKLGLWAGLIQEEADVIQSR